MKLTFTIDKKMALTILVLTTINLVIFKLGEAGKIGTWPWWVILLPAWGSLAVYVTFQIVDNMVNKAANQVKKYTSPDD